MNTLRQWQQIMVRFKSGPLDDEYRSLVYHSRVTDFCASPHHLYTLAPAVLVITPSAWKQIPLVRSGR